MARGRPGGTVTFLFTDIEDSTRRCEEDPRDMADALRVHDAILRGAIERHSGYVFGTGGDGFCAAFSTAADAAALESQTELRDDSAVDFAVRMGLHTLGPGWDDRLHVLRRELPEPRAGVARRGPLRVPRLLPGGR